MSDIAQLMRAANPVPDAAKALTHDELNALLLLTRTRSGNMDVKSLETTGGQENESRYRGWLVAAATFAAIVVVAGIGLMVANLGDEAPTEPFASGDALSVADVYFEAYNAGDVEAVVELFTPEATFTDDFGAQTRADWEQLLVWNAAQGTTLSPPDCTVTGEVSGVSVSVFCFHNNLDALVQAVDGPPVPIGLTLTVTPDGIQEWTFDFGDPDFNTVGLPFERWMSENHPEDLAAVGFGNWSSVEEAEQNGILTAQYAAEWAAYLKANNCTYTDGC